ncbi:MAG: hypothetical protein KAG61_14060 [Bacteriovoracaceae bacterium]|nr:hypothetical protein [Bacteriovoracaceae bacterium]
MIFAIDPEISRLGSSSPLPLKASIFVAIGRKKDPTIYVGSLDSSEVLIGCSSYLESYDSTNGHHRIIGVCDMERVQKAYPTLKLNFYHEAYDFRPSIYFAYLAGYFGQSCSRISCESFERSMYRKGIEFLIEVGQFENRVSDNYYLISSLDEKTFNENAETINMLFEPLSEEGSAWTTLVHTPLFTTNY